jgi:hypothetical protein
MKEGRERNRCTLLFQYECKKWDSLILIGNLGNGGRGGEERIRRGEVSPMLRGRE